MHNSYRGWLPTLAITLAAGTPILAAPPVRPPVIDMHLHAGALNLISPVPMCPGDKVTDYAAADPRGPVETSAAPPCDRPIFSPTSSAALKSDTIAELRRYNVRRAVLAGSPEQVDQWRNAAPGLFIPAMSFDPRSSGSLAALRKMHDSGRADVFAEIGAQYLGIRADDARLEPFWALAEQLDVPVGIHLGEGMPGQPGDGSDGYRVRLTSPFQLEEVLIKHPRLRVYVMHAASPLIDEMIAMLFEYPSLHVDVGANVWNMPRAQFYEQLKRLADAGFSKRILFGSDQTIWPQGIGLGVAAIEEAPFLSREQKRNILYNNAARFLRLTRAEIDRDHGR